MLEKTELKSYEQYKKRGMKRTIMSLKRVSSSMEALDNKVLTLFIERDTLNKELEILIKVVDDLNKKRK